MFTCCETRNEEKIPDFRVTYFTNPAFKPKVLEFIYITRAYWYPEKKL